MKEKVFERKAELLESALNEFSAKKYDDASLNTIIKNAGISKGTFYYHFKDKQELYLFLLEHSSKAKWEFINSNIGDLKDKHSEMDIFEEFKLQARIGVKFGISFPKYHKLTKMMIKEKGNPIFEIVKTTLGSDSEKMLEEMIVKAIDKGDFNKNFPKDFLVKTVSYMFIHFDEIFYEEKDFELEKIIENLDNYVDFVKHGLGALVPSS